ncbi:hypothetical protein J4482_03560 [Candidatus Woesearchaeota archaeon]|nr:hypothetical protein [Candidatus Woesearchaeota archaeon]
MISNKNSKKRNYTDNSLDSYNLVMSIRQGTNWGSKRILDYIITKGFCTSLGSIEGWIYGGKKPFSIKNVNQIKESSKNLTSEKAYILGTLCGDGYISTGYRLGLKVADKDFAEYFKGCLERIYGAPCSISERIIKPTNFCNHPKNMYVASLVSKLTVEDLQENNKYSFKTKEWRVPEIIKSSSKEIQASFIKGFADSEGCVKFRKGRGEVTMWSINKDGLNEIHEMLTNTFGLRVSFGLRRSDNPIYYLGISNYDSLNLFCEDIGFTIKRKQDLLKQLVGSYKRKGLKKHSSEIKHLAIELLSSGLNHYQIAKLLNISPTNVYDWEKKVQLECYL